MVNAITEVVIYAITDLWYMKYNNQFLETEKYENF